MAEYIEREKLLNDLQEEIDFETSQYTEEQNKYFNMGLKCAVRDIKTQPTADVVKVVRCKECKHYEETGIGEFDIPLGICKVHKILFDDEPIEVNETDFCSYGELKECNNNA